MFFRMIRRAITRQFRRMIMVAFTVALGVSLATAMLNVVFDVGDKVNQELKTYGANINIIPKGSTFINDVYGLEQNNEGVTNYIQESKLANLKTIFWAHNIVDFTPYLEVTGIINGKDKVNITGTWFSKKLELPTGEIVKTGMIRMKDWWELGAHWLGDNMTDGIMIGKDISDKYLLNIGDSVSLKIGDEERKFVVKSSFTSGSKEDEVIFLPLKTVQEMLKITDKVTRVEVSALTTPDNELSRRAAENPKLLSIDDYETWYCTAYVSSVCFQIDEVIPDAIAKPIRQVAESEGEILNKTKLIMILITILSMLGSALAISNLVTASVMERSNEIGLLKAIGANDAPIAILILVETLVITFIGSVIGYFAGLLFAQIIGHSVFSASINIKPVVIPVVGVLVTLVTLLGSIPAIKLLLKLKPAEVLHGR